MSTLVTPDFSEAQDPIDEGTYYAKIDKVEQKTSKNGHAMLNWTLETFNEQDPKNNGRKVWHTTMLEGRGAGMLKDFLQKVSGGEYQGGAFDPSEFVNREMQIVIAKDAEGRTNIKGIKSV